MRLLPAAIEEGSEAMAERVLKSWIKFECPRCGFDHRLTEVVPLGAIQRCKCGWEGPLTTENAQVLDYWQEDGETEIFPYLGSMKEDR
jgi:predicted RNA-binding Zn-ribbon protein involved in translation (DUF1610 family)